MNNDGIYERSINLPLSFIGSSKKDIDWSCDDSAPGKALEIAAIEGTYPHDFDIVVIVITIDLLDGSAWYELGGLEGAGCPSTGVVATLFYATTREKCRYTDGELYPMVFSILYDAGDRGCNCGITTYGTIAFSEIGSELADPVKGHVISGTVAGWKTCQCSCKRSDAQGNCVEWEVECARARLDIDFATFVGTDYMLPEAASGDANHILNLLRRADDSGVGEGW